MESDRAVFGGDHAVPNILWSLTEERVRNVETGDCLTNDLRTDPGRVAEGDGERFQRLHGRMVMRRKPKCRTQKPECRRKKRNRYFSGFFLSSTFWFLRSAFRF